MLPWENVQKQVLVKQAAKTNDEYGVWPDKRTTKDLLEHGIVIINKPKGPTSHMVSDYVKKIVHVSKAGHGGTLDPGVTGVLPVALAQSTRVVQALLLAGKEYVCLMKLHKPVAEREVLQRLKAYTGEITQLPPVRSAVKRQKRQRRVYYVDVLDMQDQNVLFRMGCQAGTYVRKYVHDFGKPLGGAHMAQLIRTRAGPFNDKHMVTLQLLEDAYAFYRRGDDTLLRQCILPFERAVEHLPKIWVLDSAIDSIAHGAKLHIPGVAKYESTIKGNAEVALLSLKGELLALAECATNPRGMNKEKGVAARPHTVFVKPNTYPKA